MIRLGLCCQFSEELISFRTATATYVERMKGLGQDDKRYISDIIVSNVNALQRSIEWCARHEVGCFRITSDLFPLFTHPKVGYTLDHLPDSSLILSTFAEIKTLAKSKGIRLTLHPDQFVVINSPKADVVANSIKELEYHGVLAELIGVDVINIHAGGVYGNKRAALERFVQNFSRLSDQVKSRLTVENDDKSYTPQDLLPICNELGIPFVYDVHHHRCRPDALSVVETTRLAQKTWNREPLFHISSPLEGWEGSKPYRHHDYIDPIDFPKDWDDLENVTIEVEAKAKELALLKLKESLMQRGILLWPSSSIK